jgi:hypothetical protein
LEGGALAHFYRKRIVSSEILNNLCSKSNSSLRPVRNTSISSQFRVKNGVEVHSYKKRLKFMPKEVQRDETGISR